MKRYLAKLMFNIRIENGKENSQFDEQIRLIESTSLEDAFYKARGIGKREEETFLDDQNKLVSWNFIDVAEVYQIEGLRDGEQVYSNTHTQTDAASYIGYIRQKSMEIQAKSLTFA
ncbi:MAG: DUF4288 domain-containing protein [bacterium]|nr:DUF4288 domain-containing protein [bacterium]